MGGRNRRNLDTGVWCRAGFWGLCRGTDARRGRSLDCKYRFSQSGVLLASPGRGLSGLV